ncbi:MAG: glutamyl-tRNA reductase [Cellvibrionales bacterium]|nr:glutamyl-tRNA reductase [Cellvibrionales bacterium]
MALVSFGINHSTASVELREKVAFSSEELSDSLKSLCRMESVNAAVILSTCNRTEVFADMGLLEAHVAQGKTDLIKWLADYKQVAPDRLIAGSYCFYGVNAVRQMMRVASGIDSMVVGEPQILGQMKSAYQQSLKVGCVNADLGLGIQHSLHYAKKIRSKTGIGVNPVSVAYAAINLAQHIFSDLSETNVLLIGAGETIDLVARHLVQKNVGGLFVASRNLDRASTLADKYQGAPLLLGDLGDYLPKVDIVVSSTASQLPLLGKGLVERVMAKRKHRPMFMVDIAVPRDIEPEVGDLSDVYLYTVDDLSDVVEENRKNRLKEVEKAEVIIAQGLDHYQAEVRKVRVIPAIKAFRYQSETIRDETLEKAMTALSNGEAPESVLHGMAWLLTNRLIHKPSHNIKVAAEKGDRSAIESFTALYELDQVDTTEFD